MRWCIHHHHHHRHHVRRWIKQESHSFPWLWMRALAPITHLRACFFLTLDVYATHFQGFTALHNRHGWMVGSYTHWTFTVHCCVFVPRLVWSIKLHSTWKRTDALLHYLHWPDPKEVYRKSTWGWWIWWRLDSSTAGDFQNNGPLLRVQEVIDTDHCVYKSTLYEYTSCCSSSVFMDSWALSFACQVTCSQGGGAAHTAEKSITLLQQLLKPNVWVQPFSLSLSICI